MTNAEILGNKLFELRKKSGMSQEEFADRLNVSRQAVSKWERGETLPDTDNLISIAKLYGVSLDELVGHTPTSENENLSEDTTEEKPSQSNDVKINLDDSGIHLNASNEKDKIIIDISGSGEIDVDVLDKDDEEEERYYSYNDEPADRKRKFLRFLHQIPYPIIITIAYLLWGFLADGWGVGWTLYITIPLYYTLIDCFRTKKISHFCYPILIAFIYCYIGMQWNLWHPYWILFITIPVFYVIASAIDRE